MTLGEPRDYCWEMKQILKKYEESLRPLMAEAFNHMKDCVQCKQCFLDTRDTASLNMLLTPDKAIIEIIDHAAKELEDDLENEEDL